MNGIPARMSSQSHAAGSAGAIERPIAWRSSSARAGAATI
jgi:hypothetical protein